uniref:Williams-Beuren syndrome chromosomal region 16 protein homolog n=1 Tax=Phallusia mammillata TaxID=59560 RepID=A0A6F9DPX6_9ASCI|nr:Williams-Beuren syndrome chromosomal region 16 protein homolog [Phallusia mammillata]
MKKLFTVIVRQYNRTLQNQKKKCMSTTAYVPPYSVDVKPDEQPVHKFSGRKSRQNRLHVCGFSLTGALGVLELPMPEHVRGKMTRVESQTKPYLLYLEKISYADCGYGFSLFATSRKKGTRVFGCGVNTDSQVGFHKSRIFKPKPGEQSNPSLAYVMTPGPIPLPMKQPGLTKVLEVACGRAHALILTDNEGIFCLGNNSFGQCGRDIIDGEIYINSKRVHIIPHSHFDDRIVKIVCGMDHSLFLSESGEVYSCGWGADGQTGLGTYEKTSTPTKVGGILAGVKIKKVSSFADTTLAVSDEGQVFAWGSTEYRQLASVSDSTQVIEPVLLPFQECGKIIDAACGGSACMILNENGEVFVWGYGILGKGPELESTSWPSQIPMTLFGQTNFNPDIKVTQIACGLSHFAAINSSGELFTWGKNKHGCLGLGNSKDHFFPWKVFVGSEVINVKCGVDHTIIMSKTLV